MNPPQSTIPASIPDDLELGVSAIGQGQVLATPLQMASVAQTIADGGRRSPTPIVSDRKLRPAAKPVRVTLRAGRDHRARADDPGGASGDGHGGRAPGRGGGRQDRHRRARPEAARARQGGTSGAAPEQKVDAWFTAFAPADDPKLAAAAMVVDATGTAAPWRRRSCSRCLPRASAWAESGVAVLDVELDLADRAGRRRDLEDQWPVLGRGLVHQEQHHRPLDRPVGGRRLGLGKLLLGRQLTPSSRANRLSLGTGRTPCPRCREP